MSQRVLVVEDEVSIAEAVAARLRAEGFAVEVAHDGPTAVAAAEATPPDVVVLDVMLPGFDGIEVCRRIQARRPVPVLMVTARDDETDVLIGLGVGADDYLTKPFSIRELTARVRALLRRVDRAAELSGVSGPTAPGMGSPSSGSAGSTPTGSGPARYPVDHSAIENSTKLGYTSSHSTASASTSADSHPTGSTPGSSTPPGSTPPGSTPPGSTPGGSRVPGGPGHLSAGTPPGPSGPPPILLGDVRIDPLERRVRRAGVEVHLAPTEFDLLVYLAGRPRAVLSREQLLSEVWGWPAELTTRTVDSHVKSLRRKLGAGLIRTVHGVGYALQVPDAVENDGVQP